MAAHRNGGRRHPDRAHRRGPETLRSGDAGLDLFAVAAPGLEAVVADELRRLGIRAVAAPGGAAWRGSMHDMYAANLHLRTASRVLLRIGEFQARAFYELERRARRVPWERWVAPGGLVRLRVTSRRSRLYHEGAIAERVMEAIHRRTGAVEAPRAHEVGDDDVATHPGEASRTASTDTNRPGTRKPEPEAGMVLANDDAPAQLIVVRVFRDRFVVSADTSGELLHRRGYREALAKAPLRETLAAAMLLRSGWTGQAPLIDPFCGSGTIPIEAALLARNVAPGLAANRDSPRRYAFLDWPDFDAQLWSDIVDRAREGARTATGVPILAADRDAGATAATMGNAARAGVLEDIEIRTQALSALTPPDGPGWLVTNPPYGVRAGDRDALRDLYAAFGNVARDRLHGWIIAMLSADRRLEGQVELPFQELLRTSNGGLPVRLVACTVEQ